MAEGLLDRVYIRDLSLRCVVGVYEGERQEKQGVLLNLTLYVDLRRACRTDRMDDTVDYKALEEKVVTMVESSSYFLVERLAERVADLCLEHPRVRRVEVSVEKPGALRTARSVGVEIVREREIEGTGHGSGT